MRYILFLFWIFCGHLLYSQQVTKFNIALPIPGVEEIMGIQETETGWLILGNTNWNKEGNHSNDYLRKLLICHVDIKGNLTKYVTIGNSDISDFEVFTIPEMHLASTYINSNNRLLKVSDGYVFVAAGYASAVNSNFIRVIHISEDIENFTIRNEYNQNADSFEVEFISAGIDSNQNVYSLVEISDSRPKEYRLIKFGKNDKKPLWVKPIGNSNIQTGQFVNMIVSPRGYCLPIRYYFNDSVVHEVYNPDGKFLRRFTSNKGEVSILNFTPMYLKDSSMRTFSNFEIKDSTFYFRRIPETVAIPQKFIYNRRLAYNLFQTLTADNYIARYYEDSNVRGSINSTEGVILFNDTLALDFPEFLLPNTGCAPPYNYCQWELSRFADISRFGGVFFAGNMYFEYNRVKQNNSWNIFLVKSDDSGNYTNLIKKVSQTGVVDLYPHPINQESKFHFNLKQNNVVKITLNNTLGQRLREIVLPGTVGENETNWPWLDLPIGIYFVHFESEELNKDLKVIIQ
ncbi:MAG: T9SS type A sorting domain-containing protein [Bacteroidia bacterium]|nr:T9SS type A sorting domain-containing protein [Bacteroidia bacterium]